MPGLVALREEYGVASPLKGARVAGCLPDYQTALYRNAHRASALT
jgi:S-adenosylhomocysteine hydrolase